MSSYKTLREDTLYSGLPDYVDDRSTLSDEEKLDCFNKKMDNILLDNVNTFRSLYPNPVNPFIKSSILIFEKSYDHYLETENA